jgi:hypothetical protein
MKESGEVKMLSVRRETVPDENAVIYDASDWYLHAHATVALKKISRETN